jgi:hypothetical protein
MNDRASTLQKPLNRPDVFWPRLECLKEARTPASLASTPFQRVQSRERQSTIAVRASAAITPFRLHSCKTHGREGLYNRATWQFNLHLSKLKNIGCIMTITKDHQRPIF